jgi:hypothetical protein
MEVTPLCWGWLPRGLWQAVRREAVQTRAVSRAAPRAALSPEKPVVGTKVKFPSAVQAVTLPLPVTSAPTDTTSSRGLGLGLCEAGRGAAEGDDECD